MLVYLDGVWKYDMHAPCEEFTQSCWLTQGRNFTCMSHHYCSHTDHPYHHNSVNFNGAMDIYIYIGEVCFIEPYLWERSNS